MSSNLRWFQISWALVLSLLVAGALSLPMNSQSSIKASKIVYSVEAPDGSLSSPMEGWVFTQVPKTAQAQASASGDSLALAVKRNSELMNTLFGSKDLNKLQTAGKK